MLYIDAQLRPVVICDDCAEVFIGAEKPALKAGWTRPFREAYHYCPTCTKKREVTDAERD